MGKIKTYIPSIPSSYTWYNNIPLKYILCDNNVSTIVKETYFINEYTNRASLHGDKLAIDTSKTCTYHGNFNNRNKVANIKILDLILKPSMIMMNV